MARRATLTLIATPEQMKAKRAAKARKRKAQKARKNSAARRITRAVRKRAKQKRSKGAKTKEQKRVAACIKRCKAGPRRRSGGGANVPTMSKAEFDRKLNEVAKRQNARMDAIIKRYSQPKKSSSSSSSSTSRRRSAPTRVRRNKTLPTPSKSQAARNRAQRIAYLRKKRGGRSPHFRKRKATSSRRRRTSAGTTARRRTTTTRVRQGRQWPKKFKGPKHVIGNQSYQVWVKKTGQKFIKRTINGKRKTVNI